MDEARVEPRGSYTKSSNRNLSFLPVVAQSRETDKEACVVIQVDDGASPSIMRADLARALGATLVPLDEPILISGISGQMVVNYDTIVYLRLTGESLHHNMATTEGAYGIRFLVHEACPVPMLLGTISMTYHDINCYRKLGYTTFGGPDARVHMNVPLLPWDQAKLFIKARPRIQPARKSLMDALHRGADMSPTEQASYSNLTQQDKANVANLLTHMTMVQDVVLDEIRQQLLRLKDMGFDTLPDADDDSITSFANTHSLSTDQTGRPPRFPPDIWTHVADHERPKVKERWDKFNEERLTEVLDELTKADIEKERPQQRLYWLAHVYANADTFFHADEDDPPLINGFEFRIVTENISVESRRSRSRRIRSLAWKRANVMPMKPELTIPNPEARTVLRSS
jgi:hypothetical protein